MAKEKNLDNIGYCYIKIKKYQLRTSIRKIIEDLQGKITTQQYLDLLRIAENLEWRGTWQKETEI